MASKESMISIRPHKGTNLRERVKAAVKKRNKEKGRSNPDVNMNTLLVEYVQQGLTRDGIQ